MLDLTLLDSNGLDTFDQLFAAASRTPILTLCSRREDALATESIQRGAQGYFVKGSYQECLAPQTLRNIIARNLVEETLFRAKTRAEIALNSIGDAVICTDVHGNIDYLNVAAERMTGWPRD